MKDPGRTIRALVDLVDVFDTVREIYAIPPGLIPVDHTIDSVSFLPLLRGAPDSAHPRTFSHGAFFDPNGIGEPTTDEAQYYLRLAPSGNIWKLIQRRDPATGNLLTDEFYNVGTDPLELFDLGTTHPEYAATRQAFDDLLNS